MGAIYSNVYEHFFMSPVFYCLMIGLKNSGKGEIFNKILCDGQCPCTYILNNHPLEYKHLKMNFFNISDSEREFRLLNHFSNVFGLIYVVDSSDDSQIDQSITVFHKLLKEESLRDSVFVIFANKQDLPNAISPTDLSKKMKINEIVDKKCKIFGTSSKTGEGICEGLDWLDENILKKFT